MLIGVTRATSNSINDCELTFLSRQSIDVHRAMEQHGAYEQLLSKLGVNVVSLPAEPQLPDAVFVEDTAVVLDEVAIITRPRAASRRRETGTIAAQLERYRPLKWLTTPATLEGGDVLRIDNALYIGLTARTNREGVNQLRELLSPLGYDVRELAVTGCLHLKTGCSYVGHGTVLANSSWVDTRRLEGFEIIDVPKDEPMAANSLIVGDAVLLPESFPQTRSVLEERGFTVQAIDVSELQKAEAGLTCLSLIFDSRVKRIPRRDGSN